MVCINTRYIESFVRRNKATNLTKKTLANGIYTYFEYDEANRITDIKNCKSDGTPLCYFAYDYDQASRITRIHREDGTNVYYEYDNANRCPSPTTSGESFSGKSD